MKAATFDIKLGLLGPEKVFVNGNDVTEAVAGVSFLAQRGVAPQVRLGLVAGAEIHEIAGEGIVEVEPAANDAARWLAGIDAQSLERAVDARLSSSPSMTSLPALVLEVLRDMATGRGEP